MKQSSVLLRPAARILGFGFDNILGVDHNDEIPDDIVEKAWRDSIRRSWRDLEHGSEVQRFTNKAFRILAETRGSITLRKTWEAGKNMTKSLPDGHPITLFYREFYSLLLKRKCCLMHLSEQTCN